MAENAVRKLSPLQTIEGVFRINTHQRQVDSPEARLFLRTENPRIAEQAVEALASFAGRSKAAFVALLQAKERSPLSEVRGQAEMYLESASAQAPTFLVQCMGHADPLLRRCAVRLPADVNKIIPEAVPPLIKALQDGDPQVRIAARNSFILVDWRAAKTAGVKLPPSYSDLE